MLYFPLFFGGGGGGSALEDSFQPAFVYMFLWDFCCLSLRFFLSLLFAGSLSVFFGIITCPSREPLWGPPESWERASGGAQREGASQRARETRMDKSPNATLSLSLSLQHKGFDFADPGFGGLSQVVVLHEIP